MKSSSLSPNFRSSFLALVALALPCTANATLLVGWHDFDGTTGDENSDVNASGFSGTLFKNSDSVDTGGDNGGGSGLFYGNSNISSGPGEDGLVRVPVGTVNNANNGNASNNGVIFSMENSSGSSVSLTSLFFDATQSSLTTVVTLAYKFGLGAGTFTTLATYPVNTFNNTGPDFSDRSFSLLGIPDLLNNQTIQFKFTVGGSGQGARLDNIAIAGISAIPEPASLLALGCVLGSGLMLRNRRIKPIQA